MQPPFLQAAPTRMAPEAEASLGPAFQTARLRSSSWRMDGLSDVASAVVGASNGGRWRAGAAAMGLGIAGGGGAAASATPLSTAAGFFSGSAGFTSLCGERVQP